MQNLKIALFQTDLLWEDIPGNLKHFDQLFKQMNEKVDLILLPEVFNTAFPVDPEKYAESVDGTTMLWMKAKAAELNCVIGGSLLLKTGDGYFNTFISMHPDGQYDQYSKRHIFHLGDEAEIIKPGSKKMIFQVNGWKIQPLICYDLRFPVWSKNTFQDGQYEYDLLVYASNWPASRSYPWKQMLISRAIENLSYVIGINRVGKDGAGNNYTGDSMLIDPKGKIQLQMNPDKEEIVIVELSHSFITEFRKKFNVGPDWDQFMLK